MRAIFLKDTICALGHGIAILQTPPLSTTAPIAPERAEDEAESKAADGHAESVPKPDGSDSS